MKNALQFAKQYCKEGLHPIPVQYKGKNPTVSGWPNLKVTPDNAEQYFNGKETNIGVRLGGGLIDIDIDDPRLTIFAKKILPFTGKIFGRASKKTSHYLYHSDHRETKTFKFNNKTLIEIRGEGSQTVVPPSTHESGEEVSWESNGKMGYASRGDITKKVGLIALASLLLDKYPRVPGDRDVICCSIAGVLLRAKYQVQEVDTFVQLLASESGDEEADQRVKARKIKTDLENDKHVYGFPTLRKLLPLNEQEIDKVLEFTQTSDEQTHKHLKFISHRSTAHELIPQPDWLISSLIMKKTAFNISGFGGSGKSSLTMLLAITGAYHLPTFLDNKVPQPFSTLIMNQEDTLNQLKLKAKAYCQHFRPTEDHVQGDLLNKRKPKDRKDIFFYSGAEEKFILGKFKKNILEKMPHYDEVKNLVIEKNIDLIVFDPFILLFEGLDENSAHDVSSAMKLLTEIGVQSNAAVVIVDHTSKQSLSSNYKNDINARQSATKGSINKMSAARGGLLLNHMTKDEAKKVFGIDENKCTQFINVLDSKNNYAPVKIRGSWLKKKVVNVDSQDCMILKEDETLARAYAQKKNEKENLLQNNILSCFDRIIETFGGRDDISVNKIAASIGNEYCYKNIKHTTVCEQIKKALSGEGVTKNTIRIHYCYDDNDTKTKHKIIKSTVPDDDPLSCHS